MKTTIDIPEALLQRAKVEAARRKTTLKMLVRTGLETVLREDPVCNEGALNRLRQGVHLGGKPMSRDEVYTRGPVS